ncbi:unannotated protein [freshwater metagenome]|uniref:Unannotated protein n=1 Tax=freshwater metagenome TaxID=449393 RepID=A0A6J7FDL2_9ZZZZ
MLTDHVGKVVSRGDLARRAGITAANERRCDSLLVGVRRTLGVDAIRTVRSRGWSLEPHALEAATRLLSQADPVQIGL